MTTIRLIASPDTAPHSKMVNEAVQASKPFDTFFLEGVFRLDEAVTLKRAGRQYLGQPYAYFSPMEGAAVMPMIIVSDELDPPEQWDWLKRLVPRFIRRLLKIQITNECGATITGFNIRGNGVHTGIRLLTPEGSAS